MEARVCIFIDGENFRNTIEDLFEDEYVKELYLPPNANWSRFIQSVINLTKDKLNDGRQLTLIRCYWYVIDDLEYNRFFEEDGFGSLTLPQKAEYFLKNSPTAISGSPELADPANVRGWRLTKFLDAKVLGAFVDRAMINLKRKSDIFQHRLLGWKSAQQKIQRTTDKLQFQRFGFIKVDLDNMRFIGEKGVDVQLAIDVVTLKDIYDICVLVSGDSDYIPAIKAVKALGKHTVCVEFLNKRGTFESGETKQLKEHCDTSITFGFDEMKGICGY